MDPNATLALIQSLLDDVTRTGEACPEVDHLAEDLAVWVVDQGNMAPDWEAFPLASSYYRTRLVGRAQRRQEG